MEDGVKVYAVRVGRQPGIYKTWAECEIQVKGFSGAELKSFASADLAQAWLTGASVPAPSSAPAESVRIYTDGTCSGNPGPGGYGVVLLDGAQRTELAQGLRAHDQQSLGAARGDRRPGGA